MNAIRPYLFLAMTVFLGNADRAFALSMAPPRPLADRVEEAEKIFVGTIVDRVAEGDWVRAELRVDKPIEGVREKERVKVIWRKRAGSFLVYDAKEGAKGIALLKDKHEGRYWLGADKFESVEKLDEVAGIIARICERQPVDDVPTFDEWVEAGKPLPEDRMWTGGTPWFDETKGKRRSAEEVYEMIYGQPAKGGAKSAPGGRFPAHWGDPPKVQTRDLRPLPGGYGQGSSTLAKWIEQNMAKDAGKSSGSD